MGLSWGLNQASIVKWWAQHLVCSRCFKHGTFEKLIDNQSPYPQSPHCYRYWNLLTRTFSPILLLSQLGTILQQNKWMWCITQCLACSKNSVECQEPHPCYLLWWFKMEDVNGVTATSGRGGKGRLFSSGSALGVRGGRSRTVPAQLPSSWLPALCPGTDAYSGVPVHLPTWIWPEVTVKAAVNVCQITDSEEKYEINSGYLRCPCANYYR